MGYKFGQLACTYPYSRNNPVAGYIIIGEKKEGTVETKITATSTEIQGQVKEINDLLVKILHYVGLSEDALGGSYEKGGKIEQEKNIEIELTPKSMNVKNINGLLAATLTITRTLQRDYIGVKGAKDASKFVRDELKKRIVFTGDNVTPGLEDKALDLLTLDITAKALGKPGLYKAGGIIKFPESVKKISKKAKDEAIAAARKVAQTMGIKHKKKTKIATV